MVRTRVSPAAPAGPFVFAALCACLAVVTSSHSIPVRGGEAAEGFFAAYAQCRELHDTFERLRCYDGLQSQLVGSEAELREDVLSSTESGQWLRRERHLAELESLAQREERGRLSADDPNYFVFAAPVNDKIDDDNHVEIYLSLKYPLVDTWFKGVQDRYRKSNSWAGQLINGVTPDRLYLHYNGLFDFYAFESNRFDSAPIISRAQNPGISFEYDFSRGRKVLRLGWFHESNGQQREEGDLPLFTLDRAREGEDFALAKVSRGWDYALIRFSDTDLFNEGPLAQSWFQYRLETRFFCDCQGFGFIDGREDGIWWDSGDDSRITDYDGLRAMLQQSLPLDDFTLDLRLDLKTGLVNSFAEHVTGRLSLGAKWENLHFTLFYFNGFGRDPSTYHLRTEYMGVGLVLQ